MEDTERQSSRQPPWHQEQDLERVSFGTWLRRQREARGIELREIADHTKISIRYLEALETDRFDVLPAPVFTKGFLSQYGRYLGLDPDQVVNTYLNALQNSDPARSEEPTGHRGPGSGVGLLLLIGLLLGLLVLGWYLIYGRDREVDPDEVRLPITAPTIQPSVPPVASAPPPIEAPAVAPLVVTLDFVDDSWLETVVDGERQLSEQVGKGESRRILGQELILLTLGNAPGVRAEVNGTPFELPPATDESGRQEVRIDLETVSRLASEDVR